MALGNLFFIGYDPIINTSVKKYFLNLRLLQCLAIN